MKKYNKPKVEILEIIAKNKILSISSNDNILDEDDIVEEENTETVNNEIIQELEMIDINNLTPIEAFNLIIKLKQMI